MGGAGDDLIIDDLDENANDDLHGGEGNDVLIGGGGFDTIHIGSQRAVVDGGNGNDFILVTEFF